MQAKDCVYVGMYTGFTLHLMHHSSVMSTITDSQKSLVFPTENRDNSPDCADLAGHYSTHCGLVGRTEIN